MEQVREQRKVGCLEHPTNRSKRNVAGFKCVREPRVPNTCAGRRPFRTPFFPTSSLDFASLHYSPNDTHDLVERCCEVLACSSGSGADASMAVVVAVGLSILREKMVCVFVFYIFTPHLVSEQAAV